MSLIKNFSSLASSPLRRKALSIIENGLQAIQPQEIMSAKCSMHNAILQIQSEEINLKKYKRVFLIGFGKGSAGISQYIERILGNRLTEGYVIDTVMQKFKKVTFTQGTHPFPSETNIAFTKKVLEKTSHLTSQDLVLVVICGGGSALFEAPFKVRLSELSVINKDLLKSGATISEINTIRKHMSLVKGGGLAKHLYPATIVSMIFSDVAGNDLSVIASGPTVHDPTSLDDVKKIIQKYNLSISQDVFTETPTDKKYFEKASNIIMLSNQTALSAMQKKAEKLGLRARVFSDRLQGNAKEIGTYLLKQTKKNEVLLAGGETTVHITGKGKGGRNQALVLAALQNVSDNEIIASIDSDGIDFYHFAGALGDTRTIEKAKQKGLDSEKYLENDDSFSFFEKVGDGIYTNRLASNVADLMMVIKE